MYQHQTQHHAAISSSSKDDQLCGTGRQLKEQVCERDRRSDDCLVLQTRLPSELVSALQGIMADYEADLSLLRTTGSDSEEAVQRSSPEAMQFPLVFPSGQLLGGINGAVKASVVQALPAYLIVAALRVCHCRQAQKFSSNLIQIQKFKISSHEAPCACPDRCNRTGRTHSAVAVCGSGKLSIAGSGVFRPDSPGVAG